MTMTVTEALAEIKTIGKRIEKKKEFIGQYLLRQEMVRDPFEKQGGSQTAIAREFQAIADLHTRVIRIRAAVQSSNLSTPTTVCGVTRSVTDWLTWRKEVAPAESKFLAAVRQQIENVRTQARQKGISIGTSGQSDLKPQDFVVNLDEADLVRRTEALEDMLGTLDGRLSLLNATTFVEVAD